jgi:predicted  nucleic acid-binding Zn-ribbon protein
MMPMVLKMTSKVLASKKALASIIDGDDGSTKAQEAHPQLATKEDVEGIKKIVNEIQEKISSSQAGALDTKKDFLNMISSLQRDISDLSAKMSSISSDVNHLNNNTRDVLDKINDAITRLISQVDKIDDFTKTSVPEFRSYHKEISKDLSDIGRDIALVERTLQNQINNTNAVKLR